MDVDMRERSPVNSRALGLALTGVLALAGACDGPPPATNNDLIEVPNTPLELSSSSVTAVTAEATSTPATGEATSAPGTDTGEPGTGDTGMADTDKADCSASGDACDTCCKATWGEGASGSLTDSKCTHCNVPQGSYQTYNECKAVCQELNCETETYNLGTGNCICGRCPGP